MADARIRAEWLGQMRFDDLSDTAWRVFTSALMWCVGNGTDGVIPNRYLRYLHPDGVVDASVRIELVKAGLWSEREDGFVMVDWAGELGQSTHEQIEKYRSDARERQRRRRERAKQAKESREATPDNPGSQIESVTPDVTRDLTPNVGKGEGEGLGNGEGIQEQVLVTDWPTVQIPDSGPSWGEPSAPGNVIESRVTSGVREHETDQRKTA